MKFDFMQKTQGMSYCSRLAKHLHKRSIDEVLVYPYYMEEFKPDLIKNYLQQLRKENLIVFAESK
jgi:secreted Zn-dependent insulinase-like peptidase